MEYLKLISVRIDKAVDLKLEEIAKRSRGKSKSDIIRDALTSFVKENISLDF